VAPVDSEFRRRVAAVALVTIGILYAILASWTDPFTTGADVITALPLGVALVAFVVRTTALRRAPVTSHLPRRTDDPPAGTPVPFAWGVACWVVMAALVVGWELFNYANSPRAAHPTVSSLLDAVDSSHVGKSITFFLWLLLGWYLIAS
jgi:hypothetical protein